MALKTPKHWSIEHKENPYTGGSWKGKADKLISTLNFYFSSFNSLLLNTYLILSYMGGNPRKSKLIQKEYNSLNKWSRARWNGPEEEFGQWSAGNKHLADWCGMKTILGSLRIETLIEKSIKVNNFSQTHRMEVRLSWTL